MNHREQALARIRPHPAQLKHKRDKHKGIWSSLLARVEISPSSQSLLPCAESVFSKNCTKWVLPFFLLVSYYLRRKKMHLNVDLFLKVTFFMKSALSFCVSILISNAVSFLRFFNFTVGNFNTFQWLRLLHCICVVFLKLRCISGVIALTYQFQTS